MTGVGRLEVRRRVVGARVRLVKRVVDNRERARGVSGAPRVQHAQHVDGAAQVPEVTLDAASQRHASVARRCHDDDLAGGAGRVERVAVTEFGRSCRKMRKYISIGCIANNSIS